ncbi:UNVERIFIED_CONTAM: hypothetical protein Slati_3905900 [Sesamum latifolium]|uniref:Uncharacterized protein n=1 Tax=Sesamum latifolium TaxID=2727402 RepID=A0AAW2TM80_9LAMI
MREHSSKQTISEAVTVNVESEEEDESAPTSNRFQSLGDLETEDILHQLENTQDITKITKGTEPRKKKAANHTTHQEELQEIQKDALPHNLDNRNDPEGSNTKKGELEQEIIFTDSAASSKHKRNKSLEDTTITVRSPKTGGALPEDIFCAFIYAKCYRNPRRILWEDLTRISNQNAPWLVGGDFNAILHPNENQGGDMRRLVPMDNFNDMMFDTGLIDAGFEGEPFTGLTSPESHTSPEGSQTIIHYSLMLLK